MHPLLIHVSCFQGDVDKSGASIVISPSESDFDKTCSECGKTFHSAHVMRRHFAIHTGEKKFNCWLCEYASDRKDCLKSHCIRKHEMSEERFCDMLQEMGIKSYSKKGMKQMKKVE